MTDRFAQHSSGLDSPAGGLFAITKSDGTIFTIATRSIYVGTAGDLAVTMVDGTTGTVKNAAVGYHPLRCTQVLSTGTTASDILGLY